MKPPCTYPEMVHRGEDMTAQITEAVDIGDQSHKPIISPEQPIIAKIHPAAGRWVDVMEQSAGHAGELAGADIAQRADHLPAHKRAGPGYRQSARRGISRRGRLAQRAFRKGAKRQQTRPRAAPDSRRSTHLRMATLLLIDGSYLVIGAQILSGPMVLDQTKIALLAYVPDAINRAVSSAFRPSARADLRR